MRVVRNCKERKISKYAPEEGNRYDGIYKVGISVPIYIVIQYILSDCGILAGDRRIWIPSVEVSIKKR